MIVDRFRGNAEGYMLWPHQAQRLFVVDLVNPRIQGHQVRDSLGGIVPVLQA